MQEASYDFIVIGGGASGCAAAAALARRGTTLLLERGKSTQEEPSSLNESGWPEVLGGTANDRQQTRGGSWVFTGNVLGGGTSINAGVFLKEPDGQFFDDHPHLVKSEVMRSYDNISKVSFVKQLTPISTTVIEAMMGAGIGKYHGSVDVPSNGIFAPHTLFDPNGVRKSAAALLPQPGEEGFENLTVQTQCVATRILFSTEGSRPRAIGVEYREYQKGGGRSLKQVFVNAGGEVVLSAGAIHSPKILMLSGIGDADHLNDLNIRPLVNNPDVGLHLMDQPGLPLMIHLNQPVEKTLVDIAAVTDGIHFEQASGGNIITFLAPIVQGWVPPHRRSGPLRKRLETLFDLLTKQMKGRMNQALILVAILKHPLTKGSVRLKGADAEEHLDIDNPRFLHESERKTMLDALRFLKRIVESTPIKDKRRDQENAATRFLLIQIAKIYTRLIGLPRMKYGKNSAVTFPPFPHLEFEDNDAKAKDKAIQWMNMMAIEGWHYVGTCQFGKVVDEDFKVIGVEGLRVVDASVLRIPPTINPQATLMMLGDYAGRVVIQKPLRETAAAK